MAEQRIRLIPPRIASSPSFREDFQKLFELNDEQIKKLGAFANSENGFDLSEESIEEATKNLQVDDAKLRSILRVLDFLYDRGLEHKIDEEECAKQVCNFAKKLDIKECDARLSAIRSLFAKKTAYTNHLALDYAKKAILPIISSVDIACDIRAVCEPRTEKVVGYVPMILLNIELEDSQADKRTMQLQLSEEELDQLFSGLNQARELLVSIKKEFGDKIIT